MASVLLAWIGNTDLRAAQGDEQAGAGPIAQALKSRGYDEAFLLSNYPNKDVEPFVKWLGQQSKTKLSVRDISLDRPTNFGKIYEASVSLLQAIEKDKHGLPNLTFHLSPGTPAMAAVWIVPPKYSESSVMIDVDQVLPAPVVGPSTDAYAAGCAVLLV